MEEGKKKKKGRMIKISEVYLLDNLRDPKGRERKVEAHSPRILCFIIIKQTL